MPKPTNVFERKLKQSFESSKDISSIDITDGEIRQHHFEAGLKGIKFGLAADRPTTPGTDSHFYAYFATDSGVLSCWDGSAWLTTTLT